MQDPLGHSKKWSIFYPKISGKPQKGIKDKKNHYAVGRMGWSRASTEAKRALKDGVLHYSGTWDMETPGERKNIFRDEIDKHANRLFY